MNHQFHIVAGALAIFFLVVAIAKYVTQAARKRKARKESVERSQVGDNISLHDPYPGESSEVEAEDAAAPAENAPAAPASTPVQSQPAPAQPEQTPPQESAYKWN